MDYSQYYNAAERLAVGRSLYLGTPSQPYHDEFPYSPYVAFIVRPMLHLGKLGSYRLWLITIISLLAASCIAAAWFLSEAEGAIWLLIPLFLMTGFRNWPSVIEFALGNIQFPLLFLVCLMTVSFAKGRWRAFVILLAISTMLKTWMFGFVVVPLLVREYRVAVYATATTLLLLCAAFFVVGWNQSLRFVADMHTFAVQPRLITLSASGVARQLFSTNRIMRPIFVSNVAHAVVVATFFCWIGFLAYRIFSCEWVRKSPGARMLLVPFCAACALVTLPLCHIMYFILLLPGIWTIFAMAQRARTSDAIALVAIAAACYLTLAFPTPTTNPVPTWAQVGWERLLTVLPLLSATACATVLAWRVRVIASSDR